MTPSCSLGLCHEPGVDQLRDVTGAPFWFCAVHLGDYIAKGYQPLRGHMPAAGQLGLPTGVSA